jgi:uncharacterized protein
MAQLTLTPAAARLACVAAQGLLTSPAHPAEKNDVLRTIRQLGALQIDTINIVARSPYLALFSRIGTYTNTWLDELLAEGKIFEWWAHAACFLPAEDYGLQRAIMLDGGLTWFSETWREQNREVVDGVLARVRAEGAVRSSDFERSDGRKGSWWDWKVEKKALEYWFGKGDLMVSKRVNFQRIYDLRERVRPDWDDRQAPSREAAEREMILNTVRALGVAKEAWIADYYRLYKTVTKERIKALLEEGRLSEAQVEGWSAPVYYHPDQQELIERAANGELSASHTTVLSPFDSLIWHRQRMRELFDFDFTIECYLPATKRKYGYFLLPLLHQGRLVARLDAKAHRKEGIFEVKGFFLEPNVQPDEELRAAVLKALQECAAWHRTPELVIRRCDPEGFLVH